MTLIELLEFAAAELRRGKSRQDIRLALGNADVNTTVIMVILASLNDDGSYKRLHTKE